jgi:methylated-DNA-[protein]-cysteine S-methyltransferase
MILRKVVIFMIDYLYSDYLGLYVVVEIEAGAIKGLVMTREKPDAAPAGSPVIRSLEAYFMGGTTDLSKYRLSLDGVTAFQRSVLEVIRTIPAGETMTYGEVADKAGKPGAARAVGNVMAMNPIPLILPCHRVVASNGLGGFTGGLDLKKKLLKLEGAL